jgi:tRNA threonylcarbamoyladenosine biosynthesis protein TsaB
MILCIETSTDFCSCALLHENTIYEKIDREAHSHASVLVPMIQELVKEHEVQIQDLAAVIISNGPGSYTALRIGAATAKALCLSYGLSLGAVSTLEMIEYTMKLEEPGYNWYISTIDARRDEVYVRISNKDQVIIESSTLIYNPTCFKAYEGRILIGGNGAAKSTNYIQNSGNITVSKTVMNTAKMMIPLAIKLVNEKRFEDLRLYTPNYGKNANISLRSKKLI